ncbi:MAG: ABC transporter permease subunit [Micromonosporaceae bacterium]|nr:ABC transporter permease subunit [Micromonosporaceae bacterium]
MGAPKRGLAYRIVSRLGGGIVQVLLVLVAMFWLMPTFGLFIASLRPSQESAGSGWWTATWEFITSLSASAAAFSFDNYVSILANDRIVGSLWNTVLISVPATLLVVLISAGAAYAFAWMEFPGRDWLFLIVVGLIVVPIQVGLIPDAQVFRVLGVFGTVTAAILFHVAFGLPFAVFLLRNFFIGIPRDLLEAARMDGGKEFTIFRKVVLPLGWPAIASLAIFQFLWVWNDLLVAQVFTGAESAPITVTLREQMREFGSSLDVIAPGVFLSMIVPLAVFFAFQRYFVQGVLAGSVK